MDIKKRAEKLFITKQVHNLVMHLKEKSSKESFDSAIPEDLFKAISVQLNMFPMGLGQKGYQTMVANAQIMVACAKIKDLFSKSSVYKVVSILGFLLQEIINNNAMKIDENEPFFIIIQKILDLPPEEDNEDVLNIQESAEKQAKKMFKALQNRGFYL